MNYYQKQGRISLKDRPQIIRIMKLICFILMAVMLEMGATAYSQTTKLNAQFADVTVKDAFKTIEEQSEFRFFYSDDLSFINNRINLDARNMSIVAVLDKILNKSDLTYRIFENNLIIITPAGTIQGATVTGMVIDASGEPLPGVNVIIKGTTTGVVTDIDGKYTLAVPGNDVALVFSFIGFVAQEIVVGEQRILDITMLENTQELEEVVVVGYGVVRKRDLTGAVSQISAKSIQDMPVSHATQAMQGQVAGVQVRQTSATPGGGADIKVRGSGSISASSSPLYVVDGFPLGDQNLNVVNPNDIESIEILKDASSAAIYGSRGANGVVLVTTKSGKSGRRNVSLDAYVGWQQVEKRMDMLNRNDFIDLSKDAFNNHYLDVYPNADLSQPVTSRPASERFRYPAIFDTNPGSLPDTDWQDEIFRVAMMQNYQLSVNGGDGKTQYAFSGGYFKQDGVVINSGYERFNARAKVDSRLNDFIKLGINITPSYSKEKRIIDGHWASDGVVLAALATPAVVPVYNPDGSYGSASAYAVQSDGLTGVTNAVANSTIQNNYTTLRVLANMYAEIDFTPHIKFRTTIGGDVSEQRRNYFRPAVVPINGKMTGAATDRKAIASTYQIYNWLNENTLHFNKTFGKIHALDAVAGFTLQKNIYESNEANGSNFPDDIIRVVDAATVKSGKSNITEWSMLSYLGRVNYRLMDKYYLTASIRADGSSKFGKNKRYGYFPSGSVAWKVSEESFMQNINWISELKVRSSYGLTGNNSMSGGDYVALGLIDKDDYVLGLDAGNVVSGASQKTLQNDDLSWEKTKQFDVGIEFGVLKNRLYFTVDYYNRKTTDLLLNVDIPSVIGFTKAWQNIGKMDNQGVELSISSRNIVKQDFTWRTDFNISFNKNKVLALGPNDDPIRSSGGAGDTHITMVGEPIGSFYGYQQLGVFKDQADVDSYAHTSNTRPGDVKWANIDDSNNVINANDRTIIGNNHPDFNWGLNNSFTYKTFDLSIMLYGSQGSEVLHLAKRFYTQMEGNQQQMSLVKDRWRSPENPGNGTVPRANSLTTGENNVVSSRWVEDASFLRISNITLGYNLPTQIAQKIKMERARIYLSIQNVYTFTDYSGYNPEVSFVSGISEVLAPGSDYGGYPSARTWSIGCNFTF